MNLPCVYDSNDTKLSVQKQAILLLCINPKTYTEFNNTVLISYVKYAIYIKKMLTYAYIIQYVYA